MRGARVGRHESSVGAVDTGYQFKDQLKELERVSSGARSAALEGADAVITPLKWQEGSRELEEHPDKEWAEFLVKGICHGFRLGHDQAKVTARGQSGVMYNTAKLSLAVNEYLREELEAKRVWRVEGEAQKSRVILSPLGLIPKKGKPGKWRLIVNLSAPEGSSVNDGIDRRLARVRYTSVDDVVERVLKLGVGAEIAKADVSKAYRNVPVHPEDRWLLGMEWDGQVFVDGTLPFGLRSAPLLFTALGDAVEWVAKRKGASWLQHYIDDFVTVGRAGSGECAQSMEAFKEACAVLGMPLDAKKEEGPAEVLTFLGIELDTRKLEVRLPRERLKELKKKLWEWRGRKKCRKRDLLSIIGLLNHACKVVPAGRSFLRRLLDLSMTVSKMDWWLRLNAAARADIEWWWRFGVQWNGVSMMKGVIAAKEPQVVLTTDASGRWGCGAVCGNKWFQLNWERAAAAKEWSIMPKELLPIVVAAAVWGRQWRGLTILARCDNMAVVATIRSGSCKEAHAMHLRRCLAFLEASNAFILVSEHIKGEDNVVADALSRDRLSLAHSLMQEASAEAELVPLELVEGLTARGAEWSEQLWTVLQSFTSRMV